MNFFSSFESAADLKKSQVQYNHYNVFHILERKRVLHNKTMEMAAAKDGSDGQASDVLKENQSNLDMSTLAYKMYQNLSLPPLPKRYQCLNLSSHWFIDVVHNQKKRRAHRKSHGLIPFKELAQIIADNHKSADYETRSFCQDVASNLKEHNKVMQVEFTRARGQTDATAAQEQPREVTQDSPPRPELEGHVRVPSMPSLPYLDGGVESSRSASSLVGEQMIQAYKMALERERYRQLDLTSMMIAEREISMADPINSIDRMHRNNMMITNSPHPMLSAPISRMNIASAWDAQRPISAMPTEGMRDQAFGRSLPTQSARLPFQTGRADGRPDTHKSMDESSKKPAAKSDAETTLLEIEKTSKPSSNFIQLLHQMVNDPQTNGIIHWLPCGTIFNICDKKEFTKQLIPMFQNDITGNTNNEKYKAFRSCLKQLNFIRVSSQAYNGAYKKIGFVKMQAPHNTVTNSSNEYSGSSLHELAMLASGREPAQPMERYSRYPHRASLPDTLYPSAHFGHGRRMDDEFMHGYYQALAAAGASMPSYQMNNRRFSMPDLYTNPVLESSLDRGKEKNEKQPKR